MKSLLLILLIAFSCSLSFGMETNAYVLKGTEIFNSRGEHSVHSTQAYIQDDSIGIFSGVSVLAINENVYSNEGSLGVGLLGMR